MNAKQDTTESLLAEVLEAFTRIGDWCEVALEQDYLLSIVQRLRVHCYRISQPPPAGGSVTAGEQRWFRDLLAVIHRDGGHHTEKVGTEQSAAEASRIASGLLRAIDELQIELAAARDEIAVLRAERKASDGT